MPSISLAENALRGGCKGILFSLERALERELQTDAPPR